MTLPIKTSYKIKLSVTAPELLFFIGYGIYLFFLILKNSFYYTYFAGGLSKVIFIGCAVPLLVSLLMQRYKSNKVYLLAAVSLLFTGVFCLRLNGRTELIPFCLLLFCARDIKFEKVAKFTAMVGVCTILFVVLSCYAGIIPNHSTHAIVHGAHRRRQFLGFRYALHAPGMLFNCISMDLYAERNKITLRRLGAWFLLAAFLYVKTDSRLSFIFSVVVLAASWFLSRYPDFLKKKRLLCGLMAASVVICPAVSMYVTYNYASSRRWMFKLNSILENRLKLGHNALHTYKLTLFGQEVHFIGNGLDSNGRTTAGTYNYVDCMYINILIRFGVIMFIAIIIGYLVLALISIRKKDYNMLVLVTLLAAHGMIDDLMLYISFNALWFAIFSFVMDPKPRLTFREYVDLHFRKRKKRLIIKI